MDVKRTEAWKAAEWDYCAIQADLRMPIWGSKPTHKEIIGGLRRIMGKCPQFYPASVELGLRMLSQKGGQDAERILEEGFKLLLELAGAKNREREIDGVVENLEGMWRFDVSRRLLEVLADYGRLSESWHDSLAFAAARLGDFDAAEKHIEAALRLKPRDKNFWSNKGWFLLMKGELTGAGIALSKARKLAPKDPIILGNFQAYEYLVGHGGSYSDYLLRPLDRKQIDRLVDREEWEQFDGLRSDFDECRMEAFAQSMFSKGGEFRSRLASLIRTMNSFFEFVERVDSGGMFMHEDIDLVYGNLKAIMHKFIFKFGDVDRDTMEEVFEGLKAYYGFLAGRKIVAAADFRQLEREIRRHEAGLIAKMERYNAIRHDPAVSEKKKEKIRGELFEGDHEWPHI